jgi:putative transposase
MAQLSERQKEPVGLLTAERSSTKGISAMLKRLFDGTLEQMLAAEMDEHLGCVKNDNAGDNSCSGYGKKTVKIAMGEVKITVPRGRNGDFEPRVLGKRKTRTDEIEARVLAMYSKGLSTRDLEEQLRDIYGPTRRLRSSARALTKSCRS